VDVEHGKMRMFKNYNTPILNDNNEIECLEVKGMKQEWFTHGYFTINCGWEAW